MSDILLVFPPVWGPFSPPLGPAVLVELLRERGFDATAFDLNLAFYRYVLSDAQVAESLHTLQSRFADLEVQKNLSLPEAQEYVRLSHPAAMHTDPLRREVSAALDVLTGRVGGFFCPDMYKHSIMSVQRALSLYSASHGEMQVGLGWLRPGLSELSADEVCRLVGGGTGNPFAEFMRQTAMTRPVLSAKVVGISVIQDDQLIPALTLAKAIKDTNPRVHIVAGGSYFSQVVPTSPAISSVAGGLLDSIVVGEGEEAILELCSAIHSQTVQNDMSGQDSNRNTPRVYSGSKHPSKAWYDVIPSFEDFPIREYLSPTAVVPLQVSRGCYYGQCAFCSHGAVYTPGYRVRPLSSLRRTVETAIEKGAESFFVVDEDLSSSALTRLNEVMRSVGSPIWSGNVRADGTLTPDLARACFESGCRVLFVGVESASDKVLALMGKGTSQASIVETARAATDAGIWLHSFVLIGFPGEMPDDLEETARFMNANSRLVGSYGVSRFRLAKQSKMWLHPGKYGIRICDAETSLACADRFVPVHAEAGMTISEFHAQIGAGYSWFHTELLYEPHRQLIAGHYGGHKAAKLRCLWAGCSEAPNLDASPNWISSRKYKFPVFDFLLSGPGDWNRPKPQYVAFDRCHDRVFLHPAKVDLDEAVRYDSHYWAMVYGQMDTARIPGEQGACTRPRGE